MITFYLLIIALGIYDIRDMYKKGAKKEIAIYAVLGVVAVGMNWFYLSDPLRTSFVDVMLELFKLKG